jgi:alkylhydroperoxidase/carboxymuconolactone decarboxylase family protein YurZ
MDLTASGACPRGCAQGHAQGCAHNGTNWGTILARLAAAMTDQIQQALLESSTSYVRRKLAFANAIRAAEKAGITDEEIARLTGVTVSQVAAALR